MAHLAKEQEDTARKMRAKKKRHRARAVELRWRDCGKAIFPVGGDATLVYSKRNRWTPHAACGWLGKNSKDGATALSFYLNLLSHMRPLKKSQCTDVVVKNKADFVARYIFPVSGIRTPLSQIAFLDR
jgi:hypothetical protein